jgi:acetyl-CoA C-acetyltransferase
MSARTPVLIGGGQVTYRGPPLDSPELSPAGFAAEAARRALADAGVRPEQVDRIAAVRMTADNAAPGPSAFPRAVARRIGARPREAIYGHLGGQSPQAFVNECAEALHAGACDMALIVAAEATGLERAARRAGIALDWPEPADGDCDDRGPGDLRVHPVEARHGLYVPVIVYSLIEHALRARLGRSPEAHLRAMAALFAGFSRVAATNPHAQFPVARSAGFLATESAENYRVSDPYLKWLVAQDAVNQGAAVLMTTSARADALGIPQDKRVYLHGYAAMADVPLIERPDMGASRPLAIAARAALDMAGWTIGQVGLVDIYSCFPCAVSAACDALGLAAEDGARLTVTGGLPYFGGAGNGYSLFAIAEMIARLRARPGAKGLITANGGFLSKQAVGLYAAAPPPDRRPAPPMPDPPQPAPPDPAPSGTGTIETYTIAYGKGAPPRAIVIGRTESGARFAASGEAAGLLAGDPVGRTVRIASGEKISGFTMV